MNNYSKIIGDLLDSVMSSRLNLTAAANQTTTQI